MRDVFENPKNYKDSCKKQAYFTKTNFSLANMDTQLSELMEKHVKFAQNVGLKTSNIKEN